LFVTAAATLAADWPQWRGPARDGHATPATEPQTWPERLTLAWKHDVGIGHSSPVVAADRVFLHTRQGEQEVIAAYDLASGKPAWQYRYDAPYTMNPAAMSHGKGPKSTPVVHRGTICAFGISGTLTCLDAAKGSVRWQHKGSPPMYGTAMSPAGDGDMLLAHVGDSGNGAFTAFDIATGKPRWRWTGDRPAYASPVIGTVGGTRVAITQTDRQVVGLSLSDGSLLWSVPFTTDYNQNAVTPLLVDGNVVIYSGLANPMTAVRMHRQGTSWKLERLWSNDAIPAYMSTPVASGGVLFGFTHRNRGQLFAADLATGRTLWTTGGRQGDNAALIAVGRSMLALTTDAELIVYRHSRAGYEELRRYDVASASTWAHPAWSSAGIVIKDENSLALWRIGR
jgi:outer membrane protein assembly factor BamB